MITYTESIYNEALSGYFLVWDILKSIYLSLLIVSLLACCVLTARIVQHTFAVDLVIDREEANTLQDTPPLPSPLQL